ncbi:alpha-hydroxy acid oxidase [Massilia aurea]
MFYDYVDGGSWTEATYLANEADFARIKLRQRVGLNVAQRTTRSKMLDQEVAMPVALAPVGLAGMQYADGEILAARAAEKFGVPFTLSTMSICSIEEVAAHTVNPFWFQLYMFKDRSFVKCLIDRARKADCSALVLTLDVAVFGQRHKDVKNRMSLPLKMTGANIVDMLRRPVWCARMISTSRRGFGNIMGYVDNVSNMSSLAAWTTEQFDSSLTWKDVQWVRRLWAGKLIVKGIMDVEDAELAVACGADALIVSNHGGRQLDGTSSSIAALSLIADACKDRIEIHMDGGIRSGQDVARALALGAKGVHIGRPFVYGLGALGESGVTKCLEIIHNELDLTMGLCGLSDVKAISRENLVPGSH